MGIKYFFSWLKSEFPQHMRQFRKIAPPADIAIDTFMVDLNGLFHNSAAKIYRYGNYERKSLLVRQQQQRNDSLQLQIQCFEDICKTIDELVTVVRPRQSLVLCIDGVAPLSKQNQQRQRRYRGIVEDDKGKTVPFSTFDSRCITPGTKWMDFLSKYIDWHIQKKITEDAYWQSLKIYFSNEKVPGEGEHKLVNWIRKYGRHDETFCINALDADLVMLSLGTGKTNFYLLREELYDKSFDYTYVDIGKGLRNDIVHSLLFWDSNASEDQTINDFILIVFLCGNDFLPNIPSISLIDKGLSTIIDIYKRCCTEKGHLVDEKGKINLKSFSYFFHLLGQSEKSLLIDKWTKRANYIPEPLLESKIQMSEAIPNLDFEKYREEFYINKGIDNLETACHAYIDGCAWVLEYYLFGVKDWAYMYPYNYAPFAIDLATFSATYEPKSERHISPPISPFLQLLCVIPPKSSGLLPTPLNQILLSKGELSQYFPTDFKINYEGKKNKWEGIVELPPVKVDVLKKEMDKLVPLITPADLKRNFPGKCFLYRKSDFATEFKSFYGNFRSFAVTEVVDF